MWYDSPTGPIISRSRGWDEQFMPQLSTSFSDSLPECTNPWELQDIEQVQSESTASCIIISNNSVEPLVLSNHMTPIIFPYATLMAQAEEVQNATTNTDATNLAKLYGIKVYPTSHLLPSLNFPKSFPYDFMHLIWENLIKNLVLHWTGEFKGLGAGKESYAVWNAIGEATGKSGSTIPSAFGSRVPNVATHQSQMSAEMWSFWTLYLGPVLLRRQFQRPKHYTHLCDLFGCLQRFQQIMTQARFFFRVIPNRKIDQFRCNLSHFQSVS